jgi:hypothetical protein
MMRGVKGAETAKQSVAASKGDLATSTGKQRSARESYVGQSQKQNIGTKSRCCECEFVIDDDTRALKCEKSKCESWKCTKCLNISDGAYDELIAGLPLHWFCSQCEETALSPASEVEDKVTLMFEKMMDLISKLDKNLEDKADVKRVESLEKVLSSKVDEKRVTELEGRVVELEDKLLLKDQVSKEVNEVDKVGRKSLNQMVKEAVGKHKVEEEGIEERKNNIIIYRALESTSEDVDQRKASDLEFVMTLCTDVLETGLTDKDVTKLFRLGKQKEGVTRPLLIGFQSDAKKAMVMGNLRKLRSAEVRFKNISVAHDLTVGQRQALKLEIEKTRKIQEDDQDAGNWKVRVVGTQKKPKVIKIKKV